LAIRRDRKRLGRRTARRGTKLARFDIPQHANAVSVRTEKCFSVAAENKKANPVVLLERVSTPWRIGRDVPKVNLLVIIAAACQSLSIRTERHTGDTRLMRFELIHLLSVRCIPQPNRPPVTGPAGDRLAIRRKHYQLGRFLSDFEHGFLSVLRHIPSLDRSIAACGD
jgi:hypothetical protein